MANRRDRDSRFVLADFVALVAFGAALALLVPAPARASMVPLIDLPRLTSAANRIVVAEILSTTSHWVDEQQRRIYTTIEVQVAESWKGPMTAGRRFTFNQMGGSIGDYELVVHGQVVFRAGQRALLFLGGEGPSSYVVGLGQGYRPLRYEPGPGRWMVEGGDRSAAVVPRAVAPGARKLYQPAPIDRPMPLDELRGQVRALLK